jgi:hypothetical protein
VTTKARDTSPAETHVEAKSPAPTVKADEKPAAKKVKAPGECVVDDGTAHTGRATPGAKVCSAHAMHYKADGTAREENRP